jgi:hypothetical protein
MSPFAIYRYKEDPEIREMRIQAWFGAVSAASGLTPRELETVFGERKQVGKVKRSCVWDKYRRGEVAPRSGTRSYGRLNLVERVEAAYPGTAIWLTTPLWRLADKAPMEMREVRRVYESLPPLLRSIFVASPSEANGIFWRRPVEIDHVCEILLRLRDQDALVAMLAMVKEAEVVQDQLFFSAVVSSAEDLLAILQSSGTTRSDLFDRLSRYLKPRWSNPGFVVVDDDGDAEESIASSRE